MNSIVKNLSRKAMALIMNGDDPDNDIDKMYIPYEYTRVFAELIVEECMRVIYARTAKGEDHVVHNNAVSCCYGDVADHFENK